MNTHVAQFITDPVRRLVVLLALGLQSRLEHTLDLLLLTGGEAFRLPRVVIIVRIDFDLRQNTET